MPELGVVWRNIKCLIIVCVSTLEILFGLPVKEDVTTIEIDGGIWLFGLAI